MMNMFFKNEKDEEINFSTPDSWEEEGLDC